MAELILPPSTSPANPKARKCKVRGSNFVQAEDEAIAKAFIKASENSIKGAEQRSESFFSDLTQSYNDCFKPLERERRSTESVKARVKLITKACTSFSGCYGRVSRMQPTGTNGNDIVQLATGLYNGKEMRNALDDCGKDFKFLPAWNVLKEYPRYSPVRAMSDKEGVVLSSSDDKISSCEERGTDQSGAAPAEESGKLEGVRPMGRNRAKKEAQKQRIANEKLKVANETLIAQRERTAAINKYYEILLFTKGPEGSNCQDTEEYFRTMRKRVLSQLRESESKRRRQDDEEETAETAHGLEPSNDMGSSEGA